MSRWGSFRNFLNEVNALGNDQARQQLVNDLLQERPRWPWIDGDVATFVYSKMGVKNVALNLDTIEADPPFAPMTNIKGTTLWYVQRKFEPDGLLDYMLAINDPMTPLKQEKDILTRINRHWHIDPRNPLRMHTAHMDVSVLQMPKARPFADWAAMPGVKRGKIFEHTFSSVQMNFTNRKLWVYTPPDYNPQNGKMYPLLVLLDGQWMVGPLQIPFIADALIKHKRMEPIIIAMKQSGDQKTRVRDYISNDKHYSAVLTELLPFLQTQYHIDSVNLGIGGVSEGAIAAAHSALKNPAVFSHLMMLSPPLGKGTGQEHLQAYADRFAKASALPGYIFQSVGRYEARSRFYNPGRALAAILAERERTKGDINYKFAETGSGHGLVSFRSVLPEALAHTFPPDGID